MSETIRIFGADYTNVTGVKVKDSLGNIVKYTKDPLGIQQDDEGFLVLDRTGKGVSGDVNFYDYDGTLLYSYTKGEFANLTALPANPTHIGLTAQGWNWSLADAKTYVAAYGMLDIGQMYIPTDGKTHIKITIENDETTPSNWVPFYIKLQCTAANATTIDWGDGTSELIDSTALTTFSHTYASNGDYEITLSATSGKYTFGGGGSEAFAIVSGRYNSSRIRHIAFGSDTTVLTAASNKYVFNSCTKLETVILPQGIVTGCGAFAFNNSFELKCVIFPIGVNDISSPSGIQGSFSYCRNLKVVSFPSTSLTTLGGYSFTGCFSLERICLPNGSYGTGGTVFANDTSLKKAVVPAGVSSLGNGFFSGCRVLEEVHVYNDATTLGTSIFENCGKLKKVNVPGDLTALPASTFYGCVELESIELPDTVTSIGNQAFRDCTFLTEISGLENVTSFGYNTFAGCASLWKFDVPSGVTQFTSNGYQAGTFSGCTNLRAITIPSEFTSIASSTFRGCTRLEEIHLLPTTPPTLSNADAFTEISSSAVFYVPYSSDHSVLEAYQTATNWSTYASKMQEESA